MSTWLIAFAPFLLALAACLVRDYRRWRQVDREWEARSNGITSHGGSE